ncbi:unnamed protein product [Parascedosporium putredinis]|uniref:Sphingomyelin phosphodiesterase n=1 Tax=Parascedosporium putredinis TaxID=1442378 RepID=A0A9P1GUT9_9PEZI|nr:unnamed protein product [Parascedosporium putredinis]CAI7987485.1 unnamed protein product [Parascedosporium putredinis]
MHFLRPVCVVLSLARGLAASEPPAPIQLEERYHISQRALAEDIWDKFKDGASCIGCESVIVLLKGLALLGDGLFVRTLQEICKLSKAEDDDVCEGAIGLEGPIIARAVRNIKISSQTSKLFCINFLGVCDYPATTPSRSPLPATSPLPICCRPYTASDAPGVSSSPAGPNGDHRCDTPVSLEESMYAAISELVPDAIFSICTGDIVDHTVWNTSKEFNTISITDSYARMARTLGTVYGTPATTKPTQRTRSPFTINSEARWIYDLLSTTWSRWIGAEAASTARDRGRYSIRHPGTNLRIISLNTNMYYTQNYWLYQRTMDRDPDGQIAWLAAELDAAERASERVYLLGHMPLGDHNAFRDQSNYLDQLVVRYSDTIAAMFFGHTHFDQFQISYSRYGPSAGRRAEDARVVSYIGPSLTPTSGMPSFRAYLVDPDTFAVLDVETYIADMSDPTFQTAGPRWRKLYSAKETYGPLALAADQTAFDGYYLRKSRGWKAGESCAGPCRDAEICQIRAARGEDNCYEPVPGVHFNKRVEDPVQNRDECGISVSRATINSLIVKRDSLALLKKRFVENHAPTML